MKDLPQNPAWLAAALHAQRGDRKAAAWLERRVSEEAGKRNPHGLPEELLEAEQDPGSNEGIMLGRTLSKQPVVVSFEELTMHATIQARSGGGKTNLSKLIVLQLRKNGVGSVIDDRKREYADLSLFTDDCHVLHWGQLRENPWGPPPRVPVEQWLQLAAQLFCNSFFMLSAVNPLYQLASSIQSQNGFVTTSSLLQALRQQGRKGTFREQELRTQLVHRLATLQSALPSFDQPDSLDVEQASTSLIVLQADVLLPEVASFGTALLIARLLLWRIHAGKVSGLKTAIICDEAKTVFSAARETLKQYGQPLLADLVSQSRAFGISVIAADQLALPNYLTQNCGTRILLPCAPTAEREHPLNQISKEVREWFLTHAQPGHALVSTPGNPRLRFTLVPFLSIPAGQPRLREPPEWLVYKEEASPSPAETVEPEQTREHSDLSSLELRLLLETGFVPFSTTTELYKRLQISPSKGKRLVDKLERLGLLRRHSIQLSRRGRPSTLPELTASARERFDIKTPKGRGSFEHKAWQHRIAAFYKNKGFKTSIEYASPHAVDVVARKENEAIAVEIEISGENLERNVGELLKAGFGQIVIACHKKKRASIARRLAKTTVPEVIKIEVRLLQEFTVEDRS